MSYCFNKILPLSYDEAIAKVKDSLQKEGFGVLSEIDIQDKLKEKLGVDFRKYKILGACNPPNAYKALQAEPCIGTMLPCNVIVQELDSGEVQVSAIDPVASMTAVENPGLAEVAADIQGKLKTVIADL